MKLSFKKLELFVEETVALGVLHKAGGRVVTKSSRCDKIRSFPIPRNATGVRRFMGTLGITKNYAKNFAEIASPLNRLIGDVPFEGRQRASVLPTTTREVRVRS